MRLWNARSGQLIRQFHDVSGSAYITDAHFSTDDRFVVTADDVGNATVFDTDTGATVAALNAGTGYLDSARFAPNDDNVIVTGGDDGMTRIWDVANRAQVSVLSAPGSGSVDEAEFSPDGRDAS